MKPTEYLNRVLTESSIDTYEKELERADDAFNAAIRALADRVQKELVVPFCKKYKMTFMAGNGTYFFRLAGDKNKDKYEDIDDLINGRYTDADGKPVKVPAGMKEDWQKVKKACDLRTNDMKYELGSIMNDYKPK